LRDVPPAGPVAADPQNRRDAFRPALVPGTGPPSTSAGAVYRPLQTEAVPETVLLRPYSMSQPPEGRDAVPDRRDNTENTAVGWRGQTATSRQRSRAARRRTPVPAGRRDIGL